MNVIRQLIAHYRLGSIHDEYADRCVRLAALTRTLDGLAHRLEDVEVAIAQARQGVSGTAGAPERSSS